MEQDDTLWVIHIGPDGREAARTPMPDWVSRDTLPLRHIVEDAFQRGSAAIALVRRAIDAACTPTREEMSALQAAARTFDPIGLRLHDYILHYDDRAVSLRLTGKL